MNRQLWHLAALIRPFRWQLIVALGSVMISAVLGLFFPRVVGQLVDGAFITSSGTASLDQAALWLGVLFIVETVFTGAQMYLLSLVAESAVAQLRRRLYAHLLVLPINFFDSQKTGAITSRLTSDATVLQTVLSTGFSQLIRQIMLLVGSIVFLLLISVKLTLVVLAILPIVGLVSYYFGERLRVTSTQFQDEIATANASAEEGLSAVRVVQWFSAESSRIRQYNHLIQNSLEIALHRARINATFIPVATLLFFLGIVAVLWYGGRLVQAGELTGGALISFLLYNFTIADSIMITANLFGEFQKMLGASQRIFELLDTTSTLPEPKHPRSLGQVQGNIQFEGVSFRYESRAAAALHDVMVDIRPGEVVALVGPSGAGKSTFINLIPRFYDPVQGRILLDGVDLRDLTLADLRSHMAAVPQEAQLLSGTVAENIRLGNPTAKDAEVVAVAHAANAHEFISALDQGYQTLVGERGLQLSGGHRRRVAIARARLRDPKILILDEATSALDNESEAVVQSALEKLMEGRTTLIIAHRLSTIRNADRILVLDQGRVVESGTHDALLVRGGLYRDLYARQFREEAPVPA